ncbi:Crt10p [Saccharomyces eubayanus]|uniref:Crt10p n=1 Tax=Saccharomyces eubayanus TaxID=1080349 RepID=UPI0006BF5A6F|nr:CRT10-like protein [Saccharomyces eubayanus]KOG99011.1 CRT10-like protein [Saccharomyces eubayanus]
MPSQLPNETDDPFTRWLKSRPIIQRTISTRECFDSEVFLASGGWNVTNELLTLKKYYQLKWPNSSGCTFHPKTIELIEERLRSLEEHDSSCKIPNTSYSYKKTFLEDTKSALSNLEPVWGPPRLLNPAELLLPQDEKLFVQEIPLKFEPFQYTNRFAYGGLQFKNNLFVTYGSYSFLAAGQSIEVHNFDVLLNASSLEICHALLPVVMPDDEGVRNSRNSSYVKFKDAQFNDIPMLSSVNFLKICNLMHQDFLLACGDNGVVYMWEIYKVIKIFNKFTSDTLAGSDNSRERYINVDPYMVLRVEDSCWSVDAIDIDGVIYIAVGHNKPGVTVFAFDKDTGKERKYIHPLDLPSSHNVPCVNFVPNSKDSNGYITLSYCSIFGNVVTVKIKEHNSSILTSFLDTQFFGDDLWTVTPLSKNDFMNVENFESLNLNYQDGFKENMLYSICRDDFLLGYYCDNTYLSGNFGIGTLLNQFQVPVTDLRLTSSEGIPDEQILLRFTSFDRNYTTTGSIKYEYSREEFALILHTSDLDDMNHTVTKSVPCEPHLRQWTFWDDFGHKHYRTTDRGFSKYKDIISTFPQMITPSGRNKSSQYQSASDRKICEPFTYKLTDLENDIEDISREFNKSVRNLRMDKRRQLQTSKEFKSLSSVNHLPIIESGNFLWYNTDAAADWRTLSGKNLKTVLKNPEICSLRLNSVEDNEVISDSENEESGNNLTSFQRRYRNTEQRANLKSDTQKSWGFHNYVRSVKRLLESVVPGSEDSPLGYQLPEMHDEFFLVTTAHRLVLMKAHPLIITSATQHDIFPLDGVVTCTSKSLLQALNRINFVCHIKELHCVAIASQLGLVSLLRLTEYRGIYSFRQEYILGWEVQDPTNPSVECRCNRNLFNAPIYGVDEENSDSYCGVCDAYFPMGDVCGLDYTYTAGDEALKRKGYATLYVASRGALRAFKITTEHGAALL